MKQIRYNVFETNSSSTHSISICSDNNKLDKLYVEDGIVILNGGEFGWKVEDYSDPLTKANYAAVWSVQYGDEEQQEMLKQVIMEHTGANEVWFDFHIDGSSCDKNWSYIDHQSSDVAADTFASKEDLKNFIFNPGSNLHTDNDNY